MLVALTAAGVAVQSLLGASFDRPPPIRAVRAKADAYVSGTNRQANFGRVQELKVDAAPRARAYVRFDVNVKSGDVQRVSLLIWSRTQSRAGYQVRLAYDSWRERRITFANAPTVSLDYMVSGPVEPHAWNAVDVTSLTDEVSGGDGSVNLALTTRSSKGLNLASRETGLHAPRLVVERGGREGGAPTTTTVESP